MQDSLLRVASHDTIHIVCVREAESVRTMTIDFLKTYSARELENSAHDWIKNVDYYS